MTHRGSEFHKLEMATIVPRWEWRTFGRRFSAAEARFAGLQPTGVQESDETYLLAGADDNLKIRASLLDVKVLREVDAAGLERWEPVMKQGFPLAAAEVERVFAALRLQAPPSRARPTRSSSSSANSPDRAADCSR